MESPLCLQLVTSVRRCCLVRFAELAQLACCHLYLSALSALEELNSSKPRDKVMRCYNWVNMVPQSVLMSLPHLLF